MFAKTLALSVLAICATATTLAADANRQYVAAPAPVGNSAAPPFSAGVKVGQTFYVAGHIALDPATHMAPTDVDTEVHMAMDAVKETLTKAGLSMDDLVSVTVYCTDLTLYDNFNAIYTGYFHGPFPTRAFIGVSKLLRGAHFEIAGVAVGRTAKPTSK